MATERLSVRKTREVLRLKWVLGRSHREIARWLGMGVGTVSECVARARTAGVDWAAADALGDDELEANCIRWARRARDRFPSAMPFFSLSMARLISMTPFFGMMTKAARTGPRLMHSAHSLSLKGPSRRKEEGFGK